MAETEFEAWRAECQAVHKEMDRLLLAGRPQSPEERQIRQLQVAALIERRDAAARSLLAELRAKHVVRTSIMAARREQVDARKA